MGLTAGSYRLLAAVFFIYLSLSTDVIHAIRLGEHVRGQDHLSPGSEGANRLLSALDETDDMAFLTLLQQELGVETSITDHVDKEGVDKWHESPSEHKAYVNKLIQSVKTPEVVEAAKEFTSLMEEEMETGTEAKSELHSGVRSAAKLRELLSSMNTQQATSQVVLTTVFAIVALAVVAYQFYDFYKNELPGLEQEIDNLKENLDADTANMMCNNALSHLQLVTSLRLNIAMTEALLKASNIDDPAQCRKVFSDGCEPGGMFHLTKEEKSLVKGHTAKGTKTRAQALAIMSKFVDELQKSAMQSPAEKQTKEDRMAVLVNRAKYAFKKQLNTAREVIKERKEENGSEMDGEGDSSAGDSSAGADQGWDNEKTRAEFKKLQERIDDLEISQDPFGHGFLEARIALADSCVNIGITESCSDLGKTINETSTNIKMLLEQTRGRTIMACSTRREITRTAFLQSQNELQAKLLEKDSLTDEQKEDIRKRIAKVKFNSSPSDEIIANMMEDSAAMWNLALPTKTGLSDAYREGSVVDTRRPNNEYGDVAPNHHNVDIQFNGGGDMLGQLGSEFMDHFTVGGTLALGGPVAFNDVLKDGFDVSDWKDDTGTAGGMGGVVAITVVVSGLVLSALKNFNYQKLAFKKDAVFAMALKKRCDDLEEMSILLASTSLMFSSSETFFIMLSEITKMDTDVDAGFKLFFQQILYKFNGDEQFLTLGYKRYCGSVLGLTGLPKMTCDSAAQFARLYMDPDMSSVDLQAALNAKKIRTYVLGIMHMMKTKLKLFASRMDKTMQETGCDAMTHVSQARFERYLTFSSKLDRSTREVEPKFDQFATKYTVIINVINSEELKTPTFGSPDAYVVVSAGDEALQTQRTNIISSTDYPRWDETLVVHRVKPTCNINLSVYDAENFRKDVLIGKDTFPLRVYLPETADGVVRRQYTMHIKREDSAVPTGVLHIHVTVRPETAHESGDGVCQVDDLMMCAAAVESQLCDFPGGYAGPTIATAYSSWMERTAQGLLRDASSQDSSELRALYSERLSAKYEVIEQELFERVLPGREGEDPSSQTEIDLKKLYMSELFRSNLKDPTDASSENHMFRNRVLPLFHACADYLSSTKSRDLYTPMTFQRSSTFMVAKKSDIIDMDLIGRRGSCMFKCFRREFKEGVASGNSQPVPCTDVAGQEVYKSVSGPACFNWETGVMDCELESCRSMALKYCNSAEELCLAGTDGRQGGTFQSKRPTENVELVGTRRVTAGAFTDCRQSSELAQFMADLESEFLQGNLYWYYELYYSGLRCSLRSLSRSKEKKGPGISVLMANCDKMIRSGEGDNEFFGNKVRCEIQVEKGLENYSANPVLYQSEVTDFEPRYTFKWMGTSPWCRPSLGECRKLGKNCKFVGPYSESGDGASCVKGKKRLCRCDREDIDSSSTDMQLPSFGIARSVQHRPFKVMQAQNVRLTVRLVGTGELGDDPRTIALGKLDIDSSIFLTNSTNCPDTKESLSPLAGSSACAKADFDIPLLAVRSEAGLEQVSTSIDTFMASQKIEEIGPYLEQTMKAVTIGHLRVHAEVGAIDVGELLREEEETIDANFPPRD